MTKRPLDCHREAVSNYHCLTRCRLRLPTKPGGGAAKSRAPRPRLRGFWSSCADTSPHPRKVASYATKQISVTPSLPGPEGSFESKRSLQLQEGWDWIQAGHYFSRYRRLRKLQGRRSPSHPRGESWQQVYRCDLGGNLVYSSSPVLRPSPAHHLFRPDFSESELWLNLLYLP